MHSPKTTEPDAGRSPYTRLFSQSLLLQDCHVRLQGTVMSVPMKNGYFLNEYEYLGEFHSDVYSLMSIAVHEPK